MAELLPRPFGNPFGGFIGNELKYMGNVLGQGRLPYFAPNNTLGPRIGRIPPKDNTGESYRDAELRLAAAARAAAGPSAGGGLGGGNAASSLNAGFRPLGGTPEERALASEKARIAQLTAQNPELQRYEQARQLAVAPGATPQQVQSAEDIGMQMWAKANPKLAAKVKPGQAGYDAIQGVLTAGEMGAPTDLPFNTTNVLGGTPAPEGLSYGTTTPTAIPGGTPIKGGGFPQGQAAMFERFMQERPATAPVFQGSPLGTAPALGSLSYGGAVQPLGAALSDDFYKTEKAKELADLFSKSRSTLY